LNIYQGFNVPTPIQRKSIPYIMEGRDLVACNKQFLFLIGSRTGSGKSAAFIIPLVNKLKMHSKIIGTRVLILIIKGTYYYSNKRIGTSNVVSVKIIY
jgi:ATP-dependent RNA helicase DDX54/DBP10